MVVVILQLKGAIDFNVYDKKKFYRQDWDQLEYQVENQVKEYLEEKVKPRIKEIDTKIERKYYE